MDKKTQQLFDNVNRTIIKFRGVYSKWSDKHGISYNEMLVLYTIRETGCCTQKQICEKYLLPKQTINNVISLLRKNGILDYDNESRKCREKMFILSEKGKKYAAPFLKSLDAVEEKALELIGADKLNILINILSEYSHALNTASEESR